MSSSKEKHLTIIIWAAILLAIAPWVHYGRRAFICDSFIVKGHSMDPTMTQGEKVWVNKMILGPRIYTRYKFDDDTLRCFRLPGLRKLQVGDIALFNYPRGWTEEKIGFKINYVYAKRCVGIPGDSVWISDSRYHNSRVTNVGIPEGNENLLADSDNSVLIDHGVLHAGHYAGMNDTWTIKDFGPVFVPKAGICVELCDDNLLLYKDVIEYETGDDVYEWNGKVYEFKEDYYFFAGDNVLDSKDSRYFGYVPEKFVIGVITTPHRRVRDN